MHLLYISVCETIHPCPQLNCSYLYSFNCIIQKGFIELVKSEVVNKYIVLWKATDPPTCISHKGDFFFVKHLKHVHSTISTRFVHIISNSYLDNHHYTGIMPGLFLQELQAALQSVSWRGRTPLEWKFSDEIVIRW